MADLIHNLQDKIDDLYEAIRDDSDLLLEEINLDELLEDPEGYLTALAQQFVEQHLDEIEEAANAGEQYAESVMANS